MHEGEEVFAVIIEVDIFALKELKRTRLYVVDMQKRSSVWQGETPDRQRKGNEAKGEKRVCHKGQLALVSPQGLNSLTNESYFTTPTFSNPFNIKWNRFGK